MILALLNVSIEPSNVMLADYLLVSMVSQKKCTIELLFVFSFIRASTLVVLNSYIAIFRASTSVCDYIAHRTPHDHLYNINNSPFRGSTGRVSLTNSTVLKGASIAIIKVIQVRDYISHGTLHDHLYNTNNSPIC